MSVVIAVGIMATFGWEEWSKGRIGGTSGVPVFCFFVYNIYMFSLLKFTELIICDLCIFLNYLYFNEKF